MLKLIGGLFNYNEKVLKRLNGVVTAVNALEPALQKLSDADLRAKTDEFRIRIGRGETLEAIMPEAFAVVREASVRAIGKRHFDVQIIGGAVLHEGNIAEMKTGEGKTLVAALGAYLNALPGQGVHVVTVNDYLAKFHAEWMGQVYRFLGLTVGTITHDLPTALRKQAYACDITYGTNNEFGFDYLRDNMVLRAEDMVQRPLNYAIVDEVDSILIDEARTPLIISGQGEKPNELYQVFARIVPRLTPVEDYEVDEKAHTVTPTEAGLAKVEKLIGKNIYETEGNIDLSAYLIQALKAQALMKRDRDYVVKDGQVIIVDEFTGRLMFGRRYSEGLHQAIEAKEGVKVEHENQTLATITFQNYFRMYKKLSGMTGTALTEEEEFRKIYGLDVIVVPTHRPMIRIDEPDSVYRTEDGKFKAVVEEIVAVHKTGRPILVGTVSIEKSERVSSMLERRGVRHQVLNAKHHEREAEIIAQAGRLGAVTIATNMAGRGTDILLGGNPEFLARQRLRAEGVPAETVMLASETIPPADPEILAHHKRYLELLEQCKVETDAEHEQVVALGGLYIIGTERHESRRIDNQLRGRAGRQGDPGSSRFFISLEDDLMRLFGSDNIGGLLDRLGMDDSQPLENSFLTRAIENAQKRVESHHFDIRRQVLEYDDVMNKQREIIYEQRRRVLEGENLSARIRDMIDETLTAMLDTHCPKNIDPDEWNLKALIDAGELTFWPPKRVAVKDLQGCERPQLDEKLHDLVHRIYDEKQAALGEETMRQLERVVMLQVIDHHWMGNLAAMDDLREGIGLRAYGQKDPLLEYKFEAFNMFEGMINRIRDDTVRFAFKLTVVEQQPQQARRINPTPAAGDSGPAAGAARTTKKVGRNDPCPCGSGKKYKKCCGRNEA
ncbi:MAG: preprotein translocase subunit SecA [Chloroflexota bacterium]